MKKVSKVSFVFSFAAMALVSCQHYEDFIRPTGGTDQGGGAANPDTSTVDPYPGDALYPAYRTEYLAPFRENFGDETLPPVHLYFQDQDGDALVDLDFEIYRESDGAVPGNTSVTDSDGFWFDEDFAADPGAGRYIVLAMDDTASFHYDGSDSNPAIHRFTFRVSEPEAAWDFPGVAPDLIDSARASYRGEGVPAVILYAHESGTPKSSFNADLIGEDCDLPTSDRQGPGAYATNGSGFIFLTAEELCGNGEYTLDLRQGGEFDYFCGPGSQEFSYEGSPVWVDINVWCE